MEYLALVGRYWLLGMTHRALKPGCKFGYMLVLAGPGGTGKSTLLEVLSGTEFFSDTVFEHVWKKTAAEQLQRAWLYEIAELSAFSTADKLRIKAFISGHSDAYRKPYSTEIQLFPRQFVIAGTTNNASWLAANDDHRFWPVPVPRAINVQWVRTFRDQLFAEASSRIQEALDIPDLSDQTSIHTHLLRGGIA